MRGFRSGVSNVLVATCVAEEGLDVGSVDLIICFDISTKSPIRLVQRCGRTGRERGGQVYILVTEGKEHQTLMECMRQRDGLNAKILHSNEVTNNLYKLNPRMMPHDFTPQCQKMFITIAKKIEPKSKEDKIEKAKKGQKDLRTMLLERGSSSSSLSSFKDMPRSNMITKDEFNDLFPDRYSNTNYFDDPKEIWAMDNVSYKAYTSEPGSSRLSRWLEWQRNLQNTANVGHSADTEILASLLQCSDAKRFNLPPSTQNPLFNTQDIISQKITPSPVESVTIVPNKNPETPVKTKVAKKKQKIYKSPLKKDGDIRSMFCATKRSAADYAKIVHDLGVQQSGLSTNLLNLLIDLHADSNATKPCHFCKNIMKCSIISKVREHKKPIPVGLALSYSEMPDIDLIDDINADSIMSCRKAIESVVNYDVEVQNCSKNFDLDIDFNSLEEVKVLDNNDDDIKPIIENFDIGDIDDIFADSSPEIVAIEDKVKDNDKSKDEKEALDFFGLDSVEDIFADDSEDNIVISNPQENNNTKPTAPVEEIKSNSEDHALSPSILSGKVRPIIRPDSPKVSAPKQELTSSPILNTQIRKFQLSTKRIKSSTPVQDKINEFHHKTTQSNQLNEKSIANDKSMFTITQLVDMINKTGNESMGKSLIQPTNVCKDDVIDDRSSSPIIFTQADRIASTSLNNSKKNILLSQQSTSASLIVLDSDSDSNDDTQVYDTELIEHQTQNVTEPRISLNCKRKLDLTDESITSSPYFNKKPKFNNEVKPTTLQEKILSALTTNKVNDEGNADKHNKDFTSINFVFQSPFVSQKENKNPIIDFENNADDEKDDIKKNNLDMLQIFRRDAKCTPRSPNIVNGFKKPALLKRKISFDDSDDDFVGTEKPYRNNSPSVSGSQRRHTTNHKVRKKAKKTSEFIDHEAEISDEDHSGDELSDDSIGSIIDFICDENVSHHEDMQAHYLKSVKSPLKNGVFKIPELPKKYNEDVLSQYVEEDAYEMDSFCVDSHIGLTQVNEVSELELAEIVLAERKNRKKNKQQDIESTEDSPIVKRRKNVRRQIQSDSDDSS